MGAFGMAAALVLVLGGVLLLVPLRWPSGSWLLGPKLLVAALAPVMAGAASVLAAAGLVAGLPILAVVAGLAAGVFGVVWIRIAMARPVVSGASVVGAGRKQPEEEAARSNRRLPDPAGEPGWQRDVPVLAVPGTGRVLMCDLWSPPSETVPSGLAIVYLHGSAWYVLDKDLGTRRLFRQLAGHGHVVLDLAYRLFPETDVPGMVQDALRAVAWLRQHPPSGVHPTTMMVAGGSAGGHLALLAAYAGHHEPFRPPELTAAEVEVHGVVSMYGPADLAAMYHHTRQDRLPVEAPPPAFDGTVPGWARRVFGDRSERFGFERMEVAGRLDWLVGGRPEAVPGRYAQLSPMAYVDEGCPPTLLVHGTHDAMAPVTSTRLLHHRLAAAGVPVTALYLPHTDHGFDLVLPRWSPAARAELRELERFLAVLALGRHPAV